MRQLRSGILASLLVPWCWTAPLAQAQLPHVVDPVDTLPIRYRPVANLLELRVGPLHAIEVAPAFAYVGGQRFILGGSADAEQHLFVAADTSRAVQRLYWIQIEELLPTRPGSYDYSADSTVSVQGFSLAVNFRTYTTPPAAGSDRARAFALVAGHRYQMPEGATRVRLVYLPDASARREIMIIYLESLHAGPTDVGAQAALLSRAGKGLILRARP